MEFKISHPVEPFIVTQGFGVNGDYYRSHGINIKGHNGLDLKTLHGQPVYATHDGTALYEVDENQGHGVVLITNVPYDYQGQPTYFKTIYWHFCDPIKEPKFASPLAKGGTRQINKGDLLGYADSTGFSSGDHLHFGVKPVAKVGENLFTWGPTEPNNGYNGCVDPIPFFENQDYIEELQAKKISLIKQALSLAQQLYARLTKKS